MRLWVYFTGICGVLVVLLSGLIGLAWGIGTLSARDEFSFVSNHEGEVRLYLYDPRTEVTHRFVHDFGGFDSMDWSPDGRTIALVSHDHAAELLSLVDVTTGENTPLLNSNYGETRFSRPNWSPDGTRIAFSEFDLSGMSGIQWSLRVYDLETEDVTTLVENEIIVREAVWSPDSTWIAFSGSYRFGQQRPQIFIVDVVNNAYQQLTVPDWSLWCADCTYHSPTWSPDGAQVAFVASPRAEDEAHLSEIFALALEDKAVQLQVPFAEYDPARASRLDWAHDDPQFVYTGMVYDDAAFVEQVTGGAEANSQLVGAVDIRAYIPLWRP